VAASENDRKSGGLEQCPHCGAALSPWERVLLSVDHALMCKHCWYRIILDVKPDLPKGRKERK
jgi:DNA-directed RNA polymerase subunit RPC12/RpoP